MLAISNVVDLYQCIHKNNIDKYNNKVVLNYYHNVNNAGVRDFVLISRALITSTIIKLSLIIINVNNAGVRELALISRSRNWNQSV